MPLCGAAVYYPECRRSIMLCLRYARHVYGEVSVVALQPCCHDGARDLPDARRDAVISRRRRVDNHACLL